MLEKLIDQPISFRARDHRVAKLVREGRKGRTVTDDDLFEAQFGEWPVRGLQKDTLRLNEVSFSKFNGIFTHAYIEPDTPEREIHLNRLLLSPLSHGLGIFASRQAFARLHDLVDILMPELPVARLGIPFLAAAFFFSSYRYAAASSLVKLLAPSIADEVGQEHIHIMQTKDGDRSFARNAFQASANDFIQTADFWTRNATYVAQVVDMLLTLMPRDYFGADHELQARLHNVMVMGHKAWGRIPETKEELWAALYDVGLKAPRFPGPLGYVQETIPQDWLREEENKPLRETFLKHSRFIMGHFNPPIAEMSIGLNSTRNNEVLRQYWVDCLPAAYGDLLVKYGDSNGRKKMGFTDEADYDVLGLPSPQRTDDAPDQATPPPPAP